MRRRLPDNEERKADALFSVEAPLLVMAIAASLLFGSLARTDHGEGSDTDLLMINLEDETRHVSVGHLSLFIYPWRRLEKDAQSGDLFTCHLVQEAKALVDPDDYLAQLRRSFRFRQSYQEEIERASDLGWYLVMFGHELNSSLLAKRVLWCVRTVLIARSVEQRAPVFAPPELANQTRSQPARDLLTRRHHQRDDDSLRQALRAFLETELPSPPPPISADRSMFLAQFLKTSNKVALQTLKQEDESRAGYL